MDLIQRLGKQTPDTAWSLDQNCNVCRALRGDFKCRSVVFRCYFSCLIVFQFDNPSHASACGAGAVAARLETSVRATPLSAQGQAAGGTAAAAGMISQAVLLSSGDL